MMPSMDQDSRFSPSFSLTELKRLLDLKHHASVDLHLERALGRPLHDLMSRPGKKLRGRLVEIGFHIQCGQKPVPAQQTIARRLSDAVECLHAGSLVVDDLQDGSLTRRGQPSLHLTYGLSIALNAANALYFWPAVLLESLSLPAETELRMHRLLQRTLVRAHIGQALDVGVPIDTLAQNDVYAVCLASMELKSGALFGLGLSLGSLLAGQDAEIASALNDFGHGFGVGLQMFDDIGNVKGLSDPKKKREDLMLRRPTWIWACAARHYSAEVYAQFVSTVHQLPHDHKPLDVWMVHHDFLSRARTLARQHMDSHLSQLEKLLVEKNRSLESVQRLRDIATEIARAYE